MISAADGKPLPLPKDVVAKDHLFFSPDGTRLLSNFRAVGGRAGIGWLDLSNGELSPFVVPDERGLRFALSHDGNQIAVATTRDVSGEQGGNNGPQCMIGIVSADGKTNRELIEFPGRVYELAWRSDGRALYVVSNVGGAHNDLWLVPLDDAARGTRKLTFGQADEDSPSTDRNGQWLLFTDNRDGATVLVARHLKSQQDVLVAIGSRKYQHPSGRIQLTVWDDPTDPSGKRSKTTARISVRRINGEYHAPHGSIYRMLRDRMHFYATEDAELEVPEGEYFITAARGPEYRVLSARVRVRAKRATKLALHLERWTNQRAEQWYSGESHIHANYGYGQWYNSPRTMFAQSAGEDLVVSNFMVANSEADGVFDREFFRGKLDPQSTNQTLLYWNQEFRSTIWGHLTLLNLRQLVEPIFTGFADTTNPHDHPSNAQIADLTHDQLGHVNYTHPTNNLKDPYLAAYSAKALPLDVALGKIDTLDVMGSNHTATVPLWYRLLNCGFHLPASAGTDCFLNRVRSRLPGQARVYVHVDGKFSYSKWIGGLKKGRTFVTNGPMLRVAVNEKMAGSTIRLNGTGSVRVVGEVTSQYPIDKVELIVNGVVATTIDVNLNPLKIVIDEQVPVARSGWIALRASGPRHPQQPDGTVYGHTSPIYLVVDNERFVSPQDAEYFLDWIDRLRTDIRRRNRVPSRHQITIEELLAEGREVYLDLLNSSKTP
jgi:hypothetical protein